MRADWVDAVLIACGLQNLSLAIGLWFSSRSRMAARRLALALMVIAGMTLVHVLGWTGRANPSAEAAFFPLNLPLALGPLLFSYVHILALSRAPVREALHFAPALAQFVYLTAVLLTPEPVRGLWKEQVHDDVVKPFIEGMVLLSLGAYAIAGLGILRRYRAWLAMARSDADRHAGGWIARILIALLVALALLMALRMYTWFVGELETGLLQLWFAAWCAWLGVEGWRHSEHAYPPMDTSTPSVSETSNHDWAALGERWRQTTAAAG